MTPTASLAASLLSIALAATGCGEQPAESPPAPGSTNVPSTAPAMRPPADAPVIDQHGSTGDPSVDGNHDRQPDRAGNTHGAQPTTRDDGTTPPQGSASGPTGPTGGTGATGATDGATGGTTTGAATQ